MKETPISRLAIVAVAFMLATGYRAYADDTLCLEHIIFERRDTIQMIPAFVASRIDLERVGAKCYRIDTDTTTQLKFNIVWNGVVVDTISCTTPLTCKLWRVSEASESRYDNFYSWYYETYGDYPQWKDEDFRLVIIETCDESLGFEYQLHRPRK
jgi:hypothetical protein